MSEGDDKDREIAELRERLRRLEENAAPPPAQPPPDLQGGPIQPAKRPNGCLIAVVGVIVLIVLLGALAQCGGGSQQTNTAAPRRPATNSASPAATNAATATAAAPSAPEPQPSAWVYTEHTDQMRGGTDRLACITSTNELHLDFPYHDQHVQLCARRAAAYGLDVYVQMEGSGQFLCSSFDNCHVSVRFDEGAVRRYTAVGPADNSTETLFIRGAAGFITNASSAHRIMVEVPLYQAGNQQLIFETPQPLSFSGGGAQNRRR